MKKKKNTSSSGSGVVVVILMSKFGQITKLSSDGTDMISMHSNTILTSEVLSDN